MAEKKEDLFTAGEIAKLLKTSDGKVKKAIKDLAIQPTTKRGVCCLYGRDVVTKVKTAVAK
jgi:hypothetical protein